MSIENFWLPKNEQTQRVKEEMDDFEISRQEIEEPVIHLESEYSHEATPRDLKETNILIENDAELPGLIYEWYSKAISRREREPLGEDRFHSHFFEGLSFDPTYAYGDKEKGFLLGFLKYGVFTPTHFAPKTIRGGYELTKSLGESIDVPAVMSVTADLTETLSKLPAWKKLDIGFLAQFREELQQKDVVYNSHPDVQNLMIGLVAGYLAENKDNS